MSTYQYLPAGIPSGAGYNHGERVIITRDLPNRDRIVAKLEIRRPTDPGRSLSPGFSLTGEIYEARGSWSGARRHKQGLDYDAGGCIQELLRAFPNLAAFGRVHLADLDGTPMHGAANGAYFLSGKSDSYEIRTYGESYFERNGDGYARACSVLRVEEIPAGVIASEHDLTIGAREGTRLVTMREISAPAWRVFIEERQEAWRYDAFDAFAVFDTMRGHAIDAQVSEILRTANVTEPGGDWSTYDIARALDPMAHHPRTMFDTKGEPPRDLFYALARESIERLKPPGRFVGGVSQHLYAIVKV